MAHWSSRPRPEIVIDVGARVRGGLRAYARVHMGDLPARSFAMLKVTAGQNYHVMVMAMVLDGPYVNCAIRVLGVHDAGWCAAAMVVKSECQPNYMCPTYQTSNLVPSPWQQ